MAQSSRERSPLTLPCAVQLTLVGQIRNKSNQTTKIIYVMDDGTGSFEVREWIDALRLEQDETPAQGFEVGAFVRVWGNLKSFNDTRHVTPFMIRPVTDYNEVLYHMLEATAVHLHFTRGPPNGAAKGDAAAGADASHQLGGTGAATSGKMAVLSRLSPAAQKIYQLMSKSNDSNEGLHQQDIAARLGMDSGAAARAGDELLEAGVIYTTVDDHTWAVLEDDG